MSCLTTGGQSLEVYLRERREYKTLLNNAKNFRIQGLAAHIINLSMIEIAKELKAQKLNAYIALMVHDQVICIAKESQAAQVKNIMRDKMQNTVKISIPLVAEPEIADNLAESH
jgi:DNA polymerase I